MSKNRNLNVNTFHPVSSHLDYLVVCAKNRSLIIIFFFIIILFFIVVIFIDSPIYFFVRPEQLFPRSNQQLLSFFPASSISCFSVSDSVFISCHIAHRENGINKHCSFHMLLLLLWAFFYTAAQSKHWTNWLFTNISYYQNCTKCCPVLKFCYISPAAEKNIFAKDPQMNNKWTNKSFSALPCARSYKLLIESTFRFQQIILLHFYISIRLNIGNKKIQCRKIKKNKYAQKRKQQKHW